VTTLLGRAAASFRAGAADPDRSSRGVPGSAIVRSAPHCRVVVPAQSRTRHIPVWRVVRGSGTATATATVAVVVAATVTVTGTGTGTGKGTEAETESANLNLDVPRIRTSY